jgi:hypothetical protein
LVVSVDAPPDVFPPPAHPTKDITILAVNTADNNFFIINLPFLLKNYGDFSLIFYLFIFLF